MGYCECDTGYYEPSVAEEIFDRAKDELEAVIKIEIKNEIKNIKSENIKLKEEVQKYKDKERELHNRELEIKRKEEQEINSMYKSKWSETLKPLEDNFVAWRIGNKSIKKQKCDKCNDERKIVYTSEHGEKLYKTCSCNDCYTEYFPDETVMTEIDFGKERGTWGSDFKSKFYMTPRYESKDYDDTWCKLEFKRYMDNFDLDEIKKEELREYDLRQHIVWTNKEACQQCCDYLNSKIIKVEN